MPSEMDAIVRNIRISRAIRVLGLLAAISAGGCRPDWYIDPGFGERLAKEESKPLLYYFKAWDSTQHRNMKMKVLESAAVKKELMDTVNVELEFAWAGPYRTKYNVQMPQVCVMCDPTGKMVSTPFYVNPVPSEEAFASWLRQAKTLAKPAAPAGPAAARPPPSDKKPEPPGKESRPP